MSPTFWASLSTEAQPKPRKKQACGGGLDENDNAIVRLANQIIADAYRQNASDIHIEPYGEKRETLVRFRVDGDCFEYMKIPAELSAGHRVALENHGKP